MSNGLIMVLALTTMILVLGFAVWQWKQARRAKVQHHHSAATEGRSDLRREGGPGVKRE